jgi:hypothetical protein
MLPMRQLDRLRALLEKGDYAELVDQVSSRLMPTGNPVLYWDRFVVVGLAPGHAHASVRRLERSAPVPASAADLEALRRERPERAALIQRRLDEGQRCYVIRERGEIAARQWVVGDRPVYDSNSGLQFAPPARPALWCHDILVAPAYRMRGFFLAMMQNALGLGPDGRPSHLYGEIHFLNHPSLRAHLRFGYRIVQTVTLVSVMGLKVYRIEDDHHQVTIKTRHAWRVRHI